MPDPQHIVVARLSGDICTKGSQTRRMFHKYLKSNLKDALNRARTEYTFQLTEARMDIRSSDPALVDFAARVFGIASVMRGRLYPWETLQDIVDIGVSEYGDIVKGKTFAVQARRSGNAKKIPFTSPQIGRELGSALFEGSAGVDLSNPEVAVRLDVRGDGVVFYDEPTPGAGGLPLGVEGRGLALISGGFDSSVAAWKMMSRGLELDFVFFNLGGPAHEQAVIDVVRVLTDNWAYGTRPTLHSVDFRPVVGEMKAKVKGRYWQVLLKRLMLRAAEMVAAETEALTLVTGDALGQVSSQTLHNLHAVSAPIESLVMRPLVGLDKDAIISASRTVGTHDLSAQSPEYCSLDGGRPATRASARDLDISEELIDMSLIATQVATRTIERCDQIEDRVQVDVRVMSIEEGEVVLDLRDELDHTDWRLEGAIHMPFERAMQSAQMLPKSGRYVLFCDVGLKSAFLAEQLRKLGFQASSFAGGLPALKRWVARRS